MIRPRPLLLLIILTFFSWGAWSSTPLRGLRVDPAYFYNLYPGVDAPMIADRVVNAAASAGANTLFLYAYSPLHGSFYHTDYPLTEIEEYMGRENAFALVYNAARAKGLKVIAVIPVNDFRLVWQEHPDWRSKLANGEDYKPFTRTHHLSAWHPDFRIWFKGFVADLVTKFPNIYALEAVEPTIDCFWTGEPDYNPKAIAEYRKRYPNGKLGDANWKKTRALGITQLIGSMATVTHSKKILSAVVQTWPAHANGNLLSSELVRDQVGFDFDGVLNLKGSEKIDIVTGEFLWQQWSAEYGGNVFTPAWTRKAAQDFLAFVKNRSTPIFHVEISPWHGQTSTVTPTIDEFRDSLRVIKNMGFGIDVYDHSQIENRQAWSALSEWIHQPLLGQHRSADQSIENTKDVE